MADVLFSLNTLPDDPDLLKDIRSRINIMLGEDSVDMRKEILENLEIAKRVRDDLCSPTIDDYEDERKDNAKIAAIKAFTGIIGSIISLQDVIYSQQATSRLQSIIIDVLGDYDYEIQKEVVARFQEAVKDLEIKIKGRKRAA